MNTTTQPRDVYVIIYSERSAAVGTKIPYEPPICLANGAALASNDPILRFGPAWRLEVHSLLKSQTDTYAVPERLTFLVKTQRGISTHVYPQGMSQVWMRGWTDDVTKAREIVRSEARNKSYGMSVEYGMWTWEAFGGVCNREETQSDLEFEIVKVEVRQ
jgi:hypothetical protein